MQKHQPLNTTLEAWNQDNNDTSAATACLRIIVAAVPPLLLLQRLELQFAQWCDFFGAGDAVLGVRA